MADPEIRYGKVREETRFDTTGAELRQIVVPIYIGNHGPFTERFTPEQFQDGVTVAQRVQALRASLNSLPTI